MGCKTCQLRGACYGSGTACDGYNGFRTLDQILPVGVSVVRTDGEIHFYESNRAGDQ